MTFIYTSLALTGLLFLDALIELLECREEQKIPMQ